MASVFDNASPLSYSVCSSILRSIRVSQIAWFRPRPDGTDRKRCYPFTHENGTDDEDRSTPRVTNERLG